MKINITTIEVMEFLEQSNAIEGVHDTYSLIQAHKAWDYLMGQKKLTLPVILKTHKILMKGKLKPNEVGHFRKIPVYIGQRCGLEPESISEYLKALCGDINAKLTDWKEAHIIYEIIHPFVDGNGRTGRMFMNWQRLREGLPILTIHTGKEQVAYYKWFKNK